MAIPQAIPRTTARGSYLARKSVRRTIAQAVAYVLVTVGGAAMMVPFVWLVSSSLKRPEDIFKLPPQLIPNPVHWSNYREAVLSMSFGTYALNTLIITTGALAGQVLTSSLCAYAFARLRWPGRNLTFGILLSTMMLPYAVTMIPVFILFKMIGWLGTFAPLIVPAWFGGGAFNIFLLRQFFLTIPMELEDAARVDGASSWRTYFTIMLPLSRPAIAVVAIFSFMSHWNDFLGPLIYLNSNKMWTLALGIQALQGLQWGRDMTHLIMAASVMMISPVIVIFLLAQKVFIRGIVLTGMKG